MNSVLTRAGTVANAGRELRGDVLCVGGKLPGGQPRRRPDASETMNAPLTDRCGQSHCIDGRPTVICLDLADPLTAGVLCAAHHHGTAPATMAKRPLKLPRICPISTSTDQSSPDCLFSATVEIQ